MRNRTYMKQRDRRPRAAQDVTEDRRRREAAVAEFKKPTTAELLEMVNGRAEDVWKSSDIGKRTVLATKVGNGMDDAVFTLPRLLITCTHILCVCLILTSFVDRPLLCRRSSRKRLSRMD